MENEIFLSNNIRLKKMSKCYIFVFLCMPSSIITLDKCFELIKKKEKDLNVKHEKK